MLRDKADGIRHGTSGRLHQVAWHPRDLRYATLSNGWVQEKGNPPGGRRCCHVRQTRPG